MSWTNVLSGAGYTHATHMQEILVLQDLSAVFGKVDQKIVLTCLLAWWGIGGIISGTQMWECELLWIYTAPLVLRSSTRLNFRDFFFHCIFLHWTLSWRNTAFPFIVILMTVRCVCVPFKKKLLLFTWHQRLSVPQLFEFWWPETVVMVFRPSGSCDPSRLDLGPVW